MFAYFDDDMSGSLEHLALPLRLARILPPKKLPALQHRWTQTGQVELMRMSLLCHEAVLNIAQKYQYSCIEAPTMQTVLLRLSAYRCVARQNPLQAHEEICRPQRSHDPYS